MSLFSQSLHSSGEANKHEILIKKKKQMGAGDALIINTIGKYNGEWQNDDFYVWWPGNIFEEMVSKPICEELNDEKEPARQKSKMGEEIPGTKVLRWEWPWRFQEPHSSLNGFEIQERSLDRVLSALGSH